MKKIILKSGVTVLVDNQDYDWLNKHKWQTEKRENSYGDVIAYSIKRLDNTCRRRKTRYMAREIYENMTGETLTTHRCAIQAVHPDDPMIVDYQRDNVIVVDRTINLSQIRKTRGSSKYRGVYAVKCDNKWRAMISFHNQKHFLGRFVDEEDAARAYDEAAKQLDPNWIHLNFPKQEDKTNDKRSNKSRRNTGNKQRS